MKRLALIPLLFSLAVSADIPSPKPRPNPGAYSEVSYSGDAAEELWHSLAIEEKSEWALRFGNSSRYKIFRNSEGSLEIDCFERTSGGGGYPPSRNPKTSYSCTVKQSTNGQPVPHYILKRRMG